MSNNFAVKSIARLNACYSANTRLQPIIKPAQREDDLASFAQLFSRGANVTQPSASSSRPHRITTDTISAPPLVTTYVDADNNLEQTQAPRPPSPIDLFANEINAEGRLTMRAKGKGRATR